MPKIANKPSEARQDARNRFSFTVLKRMNPADTLNSDL